MLYLLVMSLSVEFPISPCPQLFQYKQENNLWTGNLKVYIQRNEFPLHIRLHLCLRAALKTVSCYEIAFMIKCYNFRSFENKNRECNINHANCRGSMFHN